MSQNPRNPLKINKKKGVRHFYQTPLDLVLVVAVDPGSIPCKCKPAKPCLTPATLEERCGSMDKPEAHPRFSARARIRPAAPNAPVSYSAG